MREGERRKEVIMEESVVREERRGVGGGELRKEEGKGGDLKIREHRALHRARRERTQTDRRHN